MPKPAASFPVIATDAQFGLASDNVQSKLTSPVLIGDASISVATPSSFPTNTIVSIGTEKLFVTGGGSNPLTVKRGFDGSAAAAYGSDTIVNANITSYHHNSVIAEIEAIEKAFSDINVSLYNFAAIQPGGLLAANISNTVNLSKVPLGVNGTNTNYYLRITGGTGTSEVVLVTGGTAVAGETNQTVTFTPVNNHSGSWTITSASSGLAEAIISLAGGKGVISINSPVTVYAPIKCWPATGDIVIRGMNGGFNSYNIITRDTSFTSGNIFELNATSGVAVTLKDLGIEQGSFTQTGCGIYGVNAAYSGYKLINVTVSNGQYGVRVKNCSLYADNLVVANAAPAGYKPVAGIFIEGTNTIPESTNVFIINSLVVSYPSGDAHQLTYGIYSTGCDGVQIVNTGATADHSLYFAPPSGDYVTNTEVIGFYSDGPTFQGITTTGAGIIGTLSINGFYINGPMSSSASVNVAISLGGNIQNVKITNGRVANGQWSGLQIGSLSTSQSIIISNVLFLDNNLSNNSGVSGIYIYDAQTGVKISNCHFVNSVNGLQKVGIIIGGTLAHSRIANNSYDLQSGVNGAPNVQYDPTKTLTDVIIEGDLIASGGTIASGTTIALPATISSIYLITGSTTTTTINGGWAGLEIMLYKTDSGTVSIGGGGNIPLARNLVQYGLIKLKNIGGNWY